MTAVERLRDALAAGNKVRGFRKPIYRADCTLDHYAQHHVEIVAGDVLEACALADPTVQVVKDLKKGSSAVPPETHVVVYADDLYALLDAVKP
jgi:hypothetical protein